MVLRQAQGCRFSDRRNAPPAWHPDQAELVLRLIEGNMRVAELIQECQRRTVGREALDSVKQRYWALGLDALGLLPGQPADTAINTGNVIITKRSSVSRFYARTHLLERRNGHVLAEVYVSCAALARCARLLRGQTGPRCGKCATQTPRRRAF